MKSSVEFLVILVTVQCLARTNADEFCYPSSSLSMVDNNDVIVTTSTSTSYVVEEFDWSQDASNAYGTETEPFAGDHDLILGDCEADHYITFVMDTCKPPENGTITQNLTVNFIGGLVVTCIKVLDMYNNTDGEDLGGYPFLDDGGIGSDHISLRLVSQEGQGMKFHTEVTADWVETTTVDTTPEETTPEVTTTEVTTTEGTTTGEPTTTTPPGGDAMSAGKFRGNWFMLCCFVLLMGRVFEK